MLGALVIPRNFLFPWPGKLHRLRSMRWVSMHSSVLYSLYSLSPQQLLGSVVRGYGNDTLAAGFIGSFSYDGLSILAIIFYNYIDVSGTDTAQWKIPEVPFFSPSGHIIYLIYAFISCIMTKCSHLSNPSLTMVLSSTTPSWPQRRRKLYDRDSYLDHLPGPRSVSFAGWDEDCILASNEIWDWIYGISDSVIIVSFMR